MSKEDRKKKTNKVTRWREICAKNLAPLFLREWTAEEKKKELARIANRDIDMPETHLGGR